MLNVKNSNHAKYRGSTGPGNISLIGMPKPEPRQTGAISEEERLRILQVFNRAGGSDPIEKTIDQRFEEQADRTPGYIALVHHDRQLTYAQLQDRVHRLANEIRGRGIQPGDIVGIIVERSTEMFVGLLGILKAGGAYLPMDPEAPPLRIHYILNDSRAALVLTGSKPRHHSKLEEIHGITPQILNLDDPGLYTKDPGNPPQSTTPGSLAYIIYTSGSTGRPKGVLVEHRNLLAYLAAFAQEFTVITKDTVVQQASYFFDTFAEEVYSVLLKGGKIAIPDHNELLDIRLFIDFINQYQVTIIDCSPLLLNELNQRVSEITPRPGNPSFKFISGGDVLKGEYINNLLKIGTVYNTYGPTESTICASYYRCQPLGESLVPIGKPIPGYRVYIRSENGDLLPVGAAGELCISSEGVTRGYLNQPGLTLEKFVADPFQPDRKMYRTGDLARWLPDGNIAFMGRIDSQVSIWGFRVEVGEVEVQLLAHPKIKDAVVKALDDQQGNKYLCAYVIPGAADPGTVTSPGLRQFLFKRLPYYMIPLHFVILESLPLTPSGKIDRKALPEPNTGASDREYTPPGTDLEKKLVKTWSEILGIKEELIGVTANFFRLGGHSLKAALLTAEIYKTFHINISVVEVFTAPTVRSLARCIEEAGANEFTAIAPIETKEYYSLSPAQKRMYLVQQLVPDSIAYNISDVMILEGELNLKRETLAEIFRQSIRRHESFRTSIEIIAGEPVQRVHEQVTFQVENYKLQNTNYKQIPNYKLQIANQAAPFGQINACGEEKPQTLARDTNTIIKSFIRPFELTKAPLLRVGLIQPAAPDSPHSLLMLDMHHIIADGLSLDVVEREFTALAGGESLSPLRIRYKDYSHWQNQRLAKKTGEIKNQESYWLKRFAGGIPELALPLDYPRPALKSYEGKQVRFVLHRQETLLLKNMAAEEKVTLFVLLLGIFNIFTAKLSGSSDIVIGTPAAGREHPDLQDLVGMFVNTLALRNDPHGEKTWRRFLKDVGTNVLEAYKNQDYQFEELAAALNLHGDAGRNPLFDVMFTLRTDDEETAARELPPSYEYFSPIARFDIILTAVEEQKDLAFILEYSTTLFKTETIKRFIDYFKNLVVNLSANPGQRLSEIEILPAEEKKQLLYDFNDTRTAYPRDKTLPQLFAEQVESTPDYIALHGCMIAWMHGEEGSITYKELNKKSRQLAALLNEKGVQPDTIVGIMMERSVEMIIGVLGILTAGGAYLPIDPQYPKERVDYMLTDSGVRLLVTTGIVANERWEGEKNLEIMFLENLSSLSHPASGLPNFKTFPSPNFPLLPAAGRRPPATSLAYIIYTSGSTGKPKGTLISHANAVRIVRNTDYIDITPADCLLQLSNYAFDGSVFDIYGALLNGAKLVLADKAQLYSADTLARVIKREKITVFFVTTALFNTLVEVAPEAFDNIRKVLFGGERVSVKHAGKAGEYLGNDRVIHVYGPTETTVFAIYYPIRRGDNRGGTIPIGKPVANTAVYILDQAMKPVPFGVTGELYIGGEGVARGYLNQPELTARKFIHSPNKSFCGVQGRFLQKEPLAVGDKVYRTGDLGRWQPDGNIEFLGRIDHQVKLRGFRIEMGEIENRLLSHPFIKKVLVTVKEHGDGDKYLCAYVVAGPEQDKKAIESAHLKTFLSGTLPDYMIPACFVKMEDFPLNANGKVDTRLLPEPGIAAFAGEYTAPRDQVEEKLVELWSEVLSYSSIGIDANFFQLGGHSLKAALLADRVHKEFNVRLELPDIFRLQTIRKLAEYLKPGQQETCETIEFAETKEYYPLAPEQRHMFYQHQLHGPETIIFNMPWIGEVGEGNDKNTLEKIFLRLLQRHESLRTSFEVIAGEPVQSVHEQVTFQVENYKLQNTNKAAPFGQINACGEDLATEATESTERRNYKLQNTNYKQITNYKSQITNQEVSFGQYLDACGEEKPQTLARDTNTIIKSFIRPFELTKAPLLRVGLIQLPAPRSHPARFLLLLDMHHIISDGTSYGILLKEIQRLAAGETLPPLPLQYKDYCRWQHSEKKKETLKKQESYWLETIKGEIPSLGLPVDFPRPAVKGISAGELHFQLAGEELKGLKELAIKENCTLFILMLALFYVLLYKLTGREDIIVSTFSAGRRNPGLHGLVGMFVNTLALRNRPAGEKTFTAFLKEVRQNTWNAYENPEYPYDTLVEKRGQTTDKRRNPLAEVNFVLQNLAMADDDMAVLQSVSSRYGTLVSYYDLRFEGYERGGRLCFTVEYLLELFKEKTVEKFTRYYKTIVSSVMSHPDQKISRIPVIKRRPGSRKRN